MWTSKLHLICKMLFGRKREVRRTNREARIRDEKVEYFRGRGNCTGRKTCGEKTAFLTVIDQRTIPLVTEGYRQWRDEGRDRQRSEEARQNCSGCRLLRERFPPAGTWRTGRYLPNTLQV